MEFKARYELIGFFALAVIVGVFGFIYWLNNAGAFGERADYNIRFSVPVSGLSVGSKVFFNGIEVGDVKGIVIDKTKPKELVARISIDKNTPMRADTKAGIEYQGLTGTAAVLLTGGEADAPALEAEGGGLPLLEADPAASRSLTQNAARALSRFDDLLARNSGRVDSILEGLQRMTGGGKKEEAGLYDLAPATDFPRLATVPTGQLVIAEPTVTLALNTDKIMQKSEAGEYIAYGDAKWTDNTPNLIQTKLIQSFENAGYRDVILRPAEALDPEHRLLIDIRGFYLTKADKPEAVTEFIVKLVDRDGKVLASKPFKISVNAASSELKPALEAMSLSFSNAAKELITWVGENWPG